MPSGLQSQIKPEKDFKSSLHIGSDPSSQADTKLNPTSGVDKALPFFEEMKDNILLLFNPYQMDLAIKEGTYLKKENSYIIKKSKKPISVKKRILGIKSG